MLVFIVFVADFCCCDALFADFVLLCCFKCWLLFVMWLVFVAVVCFSQFRCLLFMCVAVVCF